MSDSSTIKNALIKKAEQIGFVTDLLLSESTDWQVIRDYLTNRIPGIELTDRQKAKLDRFQFIYNQLTSGKYTDHDVLNSVCRMFNIEIKQAYQDMKDTRELFNVVMSIDRRFELKIQLEVNKKMMNKAIEAGDLKAYAMFEKNRVALIAQIPEEDQAPKDMFHGHQIEAAFAPELLGTDNIDMQAILKDINARRKSKIKTELFESIKFEPKDDEETTAL